MWRQCQCVALLLIMASHGAAAEITRRSFQTSDKVALSFLEAGSERAHSKNLTIALVPGWLMPGAIWRKQLDAFGRRYLAIALDPRGQGESQVAPDGYTAERRATDLHEFLAPRTSSASSFSLRGLVKMARMKSRSVLSRSARKLSLKVPPEPGAGSSPTELSTSTRPARRAVPNM